MPSQEYALSVILEAHKVFWEKIEGGGEPEKIRLYEINGKAFIRHVVDEIGALFIQGRAVKKSSICGMLDPNTRIIGKKVIKHLVDRGFIQQIKNGSQTVLILGVEKLDVSDEVVLRIWQAVA